MRRHSSQILSQRRIASVTPAPTMTISIGARPSRLSAIEAPATVTTTNSVRSENRNQRCLGAGLMAV